MIPVNPALIESILEKMRDANVSDPSELTNLTLAEQAHVHALQDFASVSRAQRYDPS